MKYKKNVQVMNMDEETQPKVLSDLTVKPVSNSNFDSVDAKPGSYMLPTVVDIANQVSVEIRENHPQCFSQLPIVVVQRYEPDEQTSIKVTDSTLSNILPNISSEIMDMEDSQKNFKQYKTVDQDESSIVSNEPSVIPPNNNSSYSLKRSSLNESLDNEKAKKCRLAENCIEEPFDTCNLKINFHKDELSNVSNETYSNSILPNNDSTNYAEETQKNGLLDSDKTLKKVEGENNSDDNKSISSKTLVFEGANVDTDTNNIKVKEEIPDLINKYEKDFKEAPEDILILKKNVQYSYAKSIRKRIKNELNILEGVEMKNELVSNKIVELDHHYYKSLSPENSYQEIKMNEVTQPTEKIDSIQIDNMNESTSRESELINIEHNDSNNLQGSVPNDSQYNSQSSIENVLIDQIIECSSADATNDIPAPVAGECLQNTVCDEGVEQMSGIFQFYDDERWKEFSNDVEKAQDYIFPKLFHIFERSDLTFQEMERMVSKKIDEIMRSRFDSIFQRKNDHFIKKSEQMWREKYMKLVHHLREIRALLRKHEQELEIDKIAVPRKLRRHIKTQTKRPKDMPIVPQLQQPVVTMHFTVDSNGVVSNSTKSGKKCSKSKKSTQNKTMVTSTLTSSDNTSNLVSMPSTSSSSFSSSSHFVIQSSNTTSLPQLITDTRSLNFTTTFGNQHCKPVFVMSNGNYFPLKLAPVITPVAAPKENEGSGSPRIKNIFSLQPAHLPAGISLLRPVPPAIPIDDDGDDDLPLPTLQLHSAQNQQIITPLQPILPAPTKRSLDKNTSKVKSRKKTATSLNSSIETINLLSPEPPEESEINEIAPSFSIGNQKSILLAALTPNISNIRILKDAHELCDESNTPPTEIFNLMSPERPKELDISVPSTSSEITNQNRLRASTQSSSVPRIQLKKSMKVKTYQKEDTSLNSHNEIVNLLSPERPDESEINDSIISSGITNQKDLCASAQQPPVPTHLNETLTVTEVNDHENYAETPDEFPYETIDLSSPEFQNELEINDLATSSEIISNKPDSDETIQTLVPTQPIETSKVAEETAYGNCVKTPNTELVKIINLSSPEFSKDTEINEPGPSSGITNHSYVLEKIEPSEPTQRKETSKVSAVVTHDNDVTISNTLHTEYLNLPAEEMCQKLKDHDPATPIQISLPSWKPIPTLILRKMCAKQTSEELILEWFVDVDTNSANVKRFEVFGRHVASEIPTHNDNWVKLGEGDFHPFPIECIFKKESRFGKCQFSIRVVDVYDRTSPFCSTGPIFLN